MKKERFGFPAVGGTSLLVSFGVLMLTMLALLSLSQSRADRAQSDASAQAVEAYYNADMEAEVILAKLRNGLEVEGAREENGIWYYSCPVSEYQTLFVEVDGSDWTILRWETVAHPEAPNETLPVWQEE